MAESDWDSVTKIGSRVNSVSSQKATVLRKASDINAASRQGSIVSTERKQSAASGKDGQFLAKVDRTDDIVAPKTVSRELAEAVRAGRAKSIDPNTGNGRTRDQYVKTLNPKIGCSKDILEILESAGKPLPAKAPAILAGLQRVMKIKLTGSDIGTDLEDASSRKSSVASTGGASRKSSTVNTPSALGRKPSTATTPSTGDSGSAAVGIPANSDATAGDSGSAVAALGDKTGLMSLKEEEA